MEWQRAIDDWRNSTAPENRHLALPVEVLCEDHSGTYQLPFACRYVEGRWQNDAAGVAVEATVIGWRVPRMKHSGVA